jgi:beta-lactamase class A
MLNKIQTLKHSVDTLIGKYTADYHLYFEDLTTHQTLETGINQRYPFGSCFKIGVLGAYLEQLTDLAELDKLITINKEDIQPGGGMLNAFDCPQYLTINNILRALISFSDGTATDLLIKWLGIDNVRSYINKFTTNSKLTHDLGGLVRITDKRVKLAMKNDPELSWHQAYSGVKQHTLSEDFTNAHDLVSLMKGFLFSNDKFNQLKKDILGSKRYFLIGTERYFPPNVKFYGKTGGLGFGINQNDTGFIEIDGQIVGCMAICTSSLNIPKPVTNHVFGLLGCEILKYYGITLFEHFFNCDINPLNNQNLDCRSDE